MKLHQISFINVTKGCEGTSPILVSKKCLKQENDFWYIRQTLIKLKRYLKPKKLFYRLLKPLDFKLPNCCKLVHNPLKRLQNGGQKEKPTFKY